LGPVSKGRSGWDSNPQSAD